MSATVRPHNLEAEQSVIGSLFLDPDRLWEVTEFDIQPGTFYRDAHQHIFKVLACMIEAGEQVDPVTVADRLEQAGTLAKAGGREYIIQLTDFVPSAASIKHYAEIVCRFYRLRQLEDLANEARASVANGELPDVVIRKIEDKLRAVGTVAIEAVSGAQAAHEVYNRACGETSVDLLYTGIAALDDILQGIEPGQLIILGAGASCGKTSFGLQLTSRWAAQGRKIGWLSVEMTAHQLMRRILSDTTGLSLSQFKHNSFNMRELDELEQAIRSPGYLNVFIDGRTDVTSDNVLGRSRALVNKHATPVLFVDHLHLLVEHSPEVRFAVNRTVDGLKKLAKDLDIVIVLLSQLGRNGEFRESQQIDASGDINLKLSRNVAAGEQETTCEISKDRDGATGTLKLWFRPFHFSDQPHNAKTAAAGWV